jgi:nicotinate-nucleotide adenylyltransferase
LGGTFDPPHIGHLWLAETAQEQLCLDQVLFLPVAQPPHKRDRGVTAVHHRLTMTQLAIKNNPNFILDTTDSDRPSPHTTVTLLPLLRAKYPNTQFWLLIGADSLRDLPSWHEPHKLIQQCRLAVLPRPGVIVDWANLRQKVMGVDTAVDLLDGPTLDISSTDIRHWAAQGHAIRHLVPTAVRHYSQQQNLYSK